jgi:bifunctional enzyme CysN/CysC
MVTGASHADGALIVIDAKEGIQENTKRHGYFLSLLGVKQVAVLVNKMDQVSYDQASFEKVKSEYETFLHEVGIKPMEVIPISGFHGDNIAKASSNMKWYQGPTLLEAIDAFKGASFKSHTPFRLPIQDVYKFTENKDDRRILAGRIESGEVKVGDKVTFSPSMQVSRVKSLEGRGESPYSTGITLEDPLFITRGEVASTENPPQVTRCALVRLFWLAKAPVKVGNRYDFKLGTAKVGCTVAEIKKVFDSSTLQEEEKEAIERHEVGEVVLDLDEEIACDLSTDILETSRFVLVENYRQAGGGLIEKVLKKQEDVEISKISSKIREKRQGHRGEIFFLTGPDIANSIGVAQEVEKTLFRRGIFVYTARFTPKEKEAYLLAKKLGAVVILVGDKAHRGMESSCSLSNLGDNKIKTLTDEILERIT